MEQTLQQKTEDIGVRYAFEKLEMAWPGPMTRTNALQFAEYLKQQAAMIEGLDFKRLGFRDA